MTKVAIVSSDGLNIDTSFQDALAFYIYEVNDQGEYRFIERRDVENKIFPEKDEAVLVLAGQLPADTEGVMAADLAPQAAQILYEKGIIALPVRRPISFALPIFGRKKRFLKRDGKILRFCGTCAANCGTCHSF